jgi:CBS-domain-containing membrane protein
MSTGLAFCYQDDAVTTAHALMDRHGREHLLVVDADGALVGMLRREDLPAGAQAAGIPQDPDGPQEPGRGVADPTPPSGLDVYSDRPRVRIAQR